MTFAGLGVTLGGLVVSLIGAAWLLIKIKPDARRYTDDGPLYPGDQESLVLPRFIRDQQRPSVLVVLGGGVQVVGGVLAIIGAAGGS